MRQLVVDTDVGVGPPNAADPVGGGGQQRARWGRPLLPP